MARAKADETKQDNGTTATMVTMVGQPGDAPDKAVEYTIPSNSAKFQDYVATLSGMPLDGAYEDFIDGLRKRVRQEAYEAVQSESTWITVGKDAQGNAIRKDLLTFPVDKFVAAFNYQWNGLSAKATMLDKTVEELDRGFGAWRAASRKHSDAGKVKIAVDGTVSVV